MRRTKDNTQIVIINPHFILGGTDTYFYRMFKWLRKHEYDSSLFLFENSSYDKSFLNQLIELGVKVYFNIPCFKRSDEGKPSRIKLNLDKSKEIFFIYARFEDFLIAKKIETVNKEYKFTHFCYMLHPEALNPGTSQIRKQVIKKMWENNYINIMDKERYNSFLNKNEISNRDDSLALFPIGIDIPEVCPVKEKNRSIFRILSILRFDFPFKAYIFGLIDTFSNLFIHYPNIRLTIIGWGEGKKEINDYISALPMKAQKMIELLGPIDYIELDKYILKSDLYVGIGTTVLEAIKNGIPAIPVRDFSYECLTSGFFYEMPYVIHEDGYYEIKQYLEDVLNMSSAEYKCLIENCYLKLVANYKLDSIMTRILNISNKTGITITDKQMKTIMLRRHLSELKRIVFRKENYSWVKQSYEENN